MIFVCKRTGKYNPLRLEEAFPTEFERNEFASSETYDLQLYAYASANFLINFELTQCGVETNGNKRERRVNIVAEKYE